MDTVLVVTLLLLQLNTIHVLTTRNIYSGRNYNSRAILATKKITFAEDEH